MLILLSMLKVFLAVLIYPPFSWGELKGKCGCLGPEFHINSPPRYLGTIGGIDRYQWSFLHLLSFAKKQAQITAGAYYSTSSLWQCPIPLWAGLENVWQPSLLEGHIGLSKMEGVVGNTTVIFHHLSRCHQDWCNHFDGDDLHRYFLKDHLPGYLCNLEYQHRGMWQWKRIWFLVSWHCYLRDWRLVVAH